MGLVLSRKGEVLTELARVLVAAEGRHGLEPRVHWGYFLVMAQVDFGCAKWLQRFSQQRLWELLQAICPDNCHSHIQQLRVDVSGYDSGQSLTEQLNDLQLVPLKGLRLQRADPPQKRNSRETWGDSTTPGSDGDGAFSLE